MHQASSLFTVSLPYCLWNSHALMLYWYSCNPWTFRYEQVQTQKHWDLGNLIDFACFRNHIVPHKFKKLVKPIINDSRHLFILCVIKDKQQSTLFLCIYLHSASLLLALIRPMGPSVTTYVLVSPTSSFIVSFLSQLVSSIPAATFSCYVTPLISSVELKTKQYFGTLYSLCGILMNHYDAVLDGGSVTALSMSNCWNVSLSQHVFYFLCSGTIPVKTCIAHASNRIKKAKWPWAVANVCGQRVRSKWIKAGEDYAFLFPSTVLNALVFVAMTLNHVGLSQK